MGEGAPTRIRPFADLHWYGKAWSNRWRITLARTNTQTHAARARESISDQVIERRIYLMAGLALGNQGLTPPHESPASFCNVEYISHVSLVHLLQFLLKDRKSKLSGNAKLHTSFVTQPRHVHIIYSHRRKPTTGHDTWKLANSIPCTEHCSKSHTAHYKNK